MSAFAELESESIFVAWRMVDGRKVPINPHTREFAKSNDPETWGTLADAESVKRKDGVAIMFAPVGNRRIVGVDLDTCRDLKSGAIEPWAKEVIDAWDSYAEVSPSGTGVKIYAYARRDEFAEMQDLIDRKASRSWKRAGDGSGHPPAIELHLSTRFYCITGEALGARPMRSIRIEDVEAVIDAGERFAGRTITPDAHRDESRSGRHYRECLRSLDDGLTYAEHLERLEDDLAAYADEDRGSGTKGERDWARAEKEFDRRQAELLSRFEHVEDDEEPKRSTLKLWTPEAVAEFKPPEEIVEGLIRVGEFSSTFGPSTAGKTFFALDLGFHVATGSAWCGKRVRKRPVLYIGLEGVDGVLNRIRAMELHYGAESPIHVMTGAFNMRDAKGPTLGFVVETVERLGVGMVIIDTLARAMSGGDENSASDMGAIVETAGRIQSATGAHVMLIHHSGKDITKGGRGSSALKPALDLEIEMSRGDGNVRQATVTKSKNSVDGDSFAFTIQGVEIDRLNSWGEPINVGVLRTAGASRFRDMSQPDDEDAQKAFRELVLLDKLGDVTWDDLRTALKRKGWRRDVEGSTWRMAWKRTKTILANGYVEETGGGHVAPRD